MAAVETADPREEVLSRYVLGNALRIVLGSLADDSLGFCNVPTLDGAPLFELFDSIPIGSVTLEDFLARLQGDECELLWPPDVDHELEEWSEAERAAELLAGRILLRLAGASEFCSKAAEYWLALARPGEEAAKA